VQYPYLKKNMILVKVHRVFPSR